jgi:hypothetical protein
MLSVVMQNVALFFVKVRVITLKVVMLSVIMSLSPNSKFSQKLLGSHFVLIRKSDVDVQQTHLYSIQG